MTTQWYIVGRHCSAATQALNASPSITKFIILKKSPMEQSLFERDKDVHSGFGSLCFVINDKLYISGLCFP